MDLLLPETVKAAEDLKNEFKCLSCGIIPSEPYFTGVCDHLLCLSCLNSKSNLCPICSGQFLKSEAHLSKMIRETLISINSIIDISSGTYVSPQKDDPPSSLPDLDISCVTTKPDCPPEIFHKTKTTTALKTLPPPMPPPPVIMTSTFNNEEPSVITKPRGRQKQNKQSQPKTRTKSTTNAKVLKDEDNLRGPTQGTTQGSQLRRTQSVKKPTKKNNAGEQPIHLAVMNEDIDKLSSLLNDNCIDPNVKDNAGWTPLHEACNKGRLDMVELLLKHNADINALGYQNNTPLHEASLNKKVECVKFLIANGASQGIRNAFGILARDFVKNVKEFENVFDAKFEMTPMMTQRVNEIREVQLMNMATQQVSQMPSTYAKKTRPKPDRKIVLYPTSMSEDGKVRLTQLANKLSIQVAKSMNDKVTHVVHNTGKTCSRTMNYMKAILMGIWIVSIDWLEDSLKNNRVLLEENDYEAEGSQKMTKSNGPFKGRMNASCQYPKLFEDCFFYLHGKFNVFEKSDVVKLVELAGGSILKREPKLVNVEEYKPIEEPHHLDKEVNPNNCCAYYVLSDVDKYPDIKHDYLKSVRPKWLFEAIDEFKILEP